jgi:hypothetical protein
MGLNPSDGSEHSDYIKYLCVILAIATSERSHLPLHITPTVERYLESKRAIRTLNPEDTRECITISERLTWL